MLNPDTKQVAFIKKEATPNPGESGLTVKIKQVTGFRPYLGGLGVASKLYQDFGLPSLAVGPLTAAFPMASVAFEVSNEGFLQLGGDLAANLKLKGLEAVVAEGLSLEELLGQVHNFLETLSETPPVIIDNESYEVLYKNLMARTRNLWFKAGPIVRTCAACPLACGNFNQPVAATDLSSLLGVCHIAANIYNDTAVAFAALSSLGYDYSHEELEAAPGLVREILPQ